MCLRYFPFGFTLLFLQIVPSDNHYIYFLFKHFFKISFVFLWCFNFIFLFKFAFLPFFSSTSSLFVYNCFEGRECEYDRNWDSYVNFRSTITSRIPHQNRNNTLFWEGYREYRKCPWWTQGRFISKAIISQLFRRLLGKWRRPHFLFSVWIPSSLSVLQRQPGFFLHRKQGHGDLTL